MKRFYFNELSRPPCYCCRRASNSLWSRWCGEEFGRYRLLGVAIKSLQGVYGRLCRTGPTTRLLSGERCYGKTGLLLSYKSWDFLAHLVENRSMHVNMEDNKLIFQVYHFCSHSMCFSEGGVPMHFTTRENSSKGTNENSAAFFSTFSIIIYSKMS